MPIEVWYIVPLIAVIIVTYCLPADENTVLCLESKYAVGKYATELLVNAICGKAVLHTNIGLASLIGAGFDQRIVNKMVNQIIKKYTS